jgi:predicted nucleotidyltransferase
MSKYEYGLVGYETLEEVEAAVTQMKDKLDNQPTQWCVVKPMINPRTIAIYSGDVIGYDSGEALTDAQIKALSTSDTLYNIYAVFEGDNLTELSEEEVVEKVNTLKRSFARIHEVNTYFDYELKVAVNVTNEDMSGYV